jgi:hypothetical protein
MRVRYQGAVFVTHPVPQSGLLPPVQNGRISSKEGSNDGWAAGMPGNGALPRLRGQCRRSAAFRWRKRRQSRSTQVLLVVTGRGPHRRCRVVIEDDQARGPDDLAQEVEFHEDLVETVTAVHECRVGDKTLSGELRKRDR